MAFALTLSSAQIRGWEDSVVGSSELMNFMDNGPPLAQAGSELFSSILLSHQSIACESHVAIRRFRRHWVGFSFSLLHDEP